MSFDPIIFLEEVAIEREKESGMRIGQAAWNVACDMYKDTMKKYSCNIKEVDCYYDDARLPHLLAFLASRVE